MPQLIMTCPDCDLITEFICNGKKCYCEKCAYEYLKNKKTSD